MTGTFWHEGGDLPFTHVVVGAALAVGKVVEGVAGPAFAVLLCAVRGQFENKRGWVPII